MGQPCAPAWPCPWAGVCGACWPLRKVIKGEPCCRPGACCSWLSRPPKACMMAGMPSVCRGCGAATSCEELAPDELQLWMDLFETRNGTLTKIWCKPSSSRLAGWSSGSGYPHSYTPSGRKLGDSGNLGKRLQPTRVPFLAAKACFNSRTRL